MDDKAGEFFINLKSRINKIEQDTRDGKNYSSSDLEILKGIEMSETIKKSWAEYEKMKAKIKDLEIEIDRLKAILGEDGEYDYDRCAGKFNRDLILMMKKKSEQAPQKVTITNTYGFKNER